MYEGHAGLIAVHNHTSLYKLIYNFMKWYEVLLNCLCMPL